MWSARRAGSVSFHISKYVSTVFVTSFIGHPSSSAVPVVLRLTRSIVARSRAGNNYVLGNSGRVVGSFRSYEQSLGPSTGLDAPTLRSREDDRQISRHRCGGRSVDHPP